MALIKTQTNYDLIIEKLKKDECTRLNCISLMMEIKPYRRSIFNQFYNSKYILHKTWNKITFEKKQEWIKQHMFKRWTKDEFVEHIIMSLKMLKFNKTIKQSFEIALDIEIT